MVKKNWEPAYSSWTTKQNEGEGDYLSSDNIGPFPDYGKRGQILSVPRITALKELVLPQLAVYASPENLQTYKDIIIPEDSIQYSSDIIRKVSYVMTYGGTVVKI